MTCRHNRVWNRSIQSARSSNEINGQFYCFWKLPDDTRQSGSPCHSNGLPTRFQSKPARVRTNLGAENAMKMMRMRTQSGDGVRVEHGPTDVTNWNEITNPSNTTESLLISRFTRLAIIPGWTATAHRSTSSQMPGAAR